MTSSLYAIIDPTNKTARFESHPDYKSALISADLTPGEIDFATLIRFSNGDTISIMVYEYGLIKPKFPTGYWILGNQLYNGPAVLYSSNVEGETIDMHKSLVVGGLTTKQPHLTDHIIWVGDSKRVEAFILAQVCIRPRQTINGEIIWEWRPKS